MIRLFSKSIKFLWMGVALTFLFVALLIYTGDAPFSIVVVVTGLWISWFGAQYSAISAHQKLLAILYTEKNPARFLTEYPPLLKRCRKASKLEAAMRAHLGNALVAQGDFDAALPYFTADNESTETVLMQTENRCSCYLYQENRTAADAELGKMDGMLANSKRRLQLRTEESRHMLGIRRTLLDGLILNEDITFLRDVVAHTNKPLHRSSTRFLLAKVYLLRNQTDAAHGLLHSIVDDGGDIWVVKQAQNMLEQN
ncbi:MAG: hypothetical protein RSF84_07495 [Ruthenibacterium sp.]